MKTLLCIQSWAGAKDHVFDMWDDYLVSGFDIWGTCPTNSFHDWPDGCKFTDRIGLEGWLNPQLVIRWVDAWDNFLNDPKFSEYDDMLVTPFDVMFFKEPPTHSGGLVTHLAGGKLFMGEKANFFFHPPWWANRVAAKIIVEHGRHLISMGEYELFAPDVFLGRIVEETGIPWSDCHVYSVNGGMMEARVAEAASMVRSGVWFIHGVVNKVQRDILRQAKRETYG